MDDLSMVLFIAVYIAGLCGLLWITRWRRKWYAVAKGALSLLFVLGGVLSFETGGKEQPMAVYLLLPALVFCALGDLLLGIANKTKRVRARPFVLGAVSFSLAHVMFCAVYSWFAPLRWQDFLLPALLTLVLLVLEATQQVRLKKMRPLGYVYVLLVGFMTAKATAAACAAGVGTPFGLLTLLGSLLFLISDVVLLFLYFGTHRPKALRYANLATYYCSILLLALSAHWY